MLADFGNTSHNRSAALSTKLRTSVTEAFENNFDDSVYVHKFVGWTSVSVSKQLAYDWYIDTNKKSQLICVTRFEWLKQHRFVCASVLLVYMKNCYCYYSWTALLVLLVGAAAASFLFSLFVIQTSEPRSTYAITKTTNLTYTNSERIHYTHEPRVVVATTECFRHRKTSLFLLN